MAFRWNHKTARYYDTSSGRFVSRAAVRASIESSLVSSVDVTKDLAGLVASGTISPADWKTAMRSEIKGEYIRQYVLGRGGIERMKPADWGSIGGMLKEQYRYLDNFADQVSGLTEGQIKVRYHEVQRASMYANSAREGYERAYYRSNVDLGVGQEKWVLGAADHCSDCLSNAAAGWVEIGTHPFPGDGSTQCLTQCKCRKDYK